MKPERVLVKDTSSLLQIVEQHGGGKGMPLTDISDKLKDRTAFICRWKCEDGTIIDFIAPNARIAAKFPPEITGDSDRIMERFFKELAQLAGDPNPFVSIVKGQAYIESMLMGLINSAVLDPQELELDRMTFRKKVKFCTAMGLIHDDVSRVLIEFANIRNRFAHQVWPDFTKKEQLDFFNVFRQSKHLKDHLIKQHSKELKILDCVWAMWIYLLGQLFQVDSKRELLNNFWKSVVDTEGVAKPTIDLPLKPIIINKKKEIHGSSKSPKRKAG